VNCKKRAQARQFSRIERWCGDQDHTGKIWDTIATPGDYTKKQQDCLARFGRAGCDPKHFRNLPRAGHSHRAGFLFQNSIKTTKSFFSRRAFEEQSQCSTFFSAVRKPALNAGNTKST